MALLTCITHCPTPGRWPEPPGLPGGNKPGWKEGRHGDGDSPAGAQATVSYSTGILASLTLTKTGTRLN